MPVVLSASVLAIKCTCSPAVDKVCVCFTSSSIAIEETAWHNHNGSISVADIVGSVSDVGSEENKISVSGVFSKNSIGNDYNGRVGGGSKAAKITLQASHSHAISISNVGGNKKHENRQPYVVVNRWKRTA